MFGKRSFEQPYLFGRVTAVNTNGTLDVLIQGRSCPYKELLSTLDPRIHRVGMVVVVGFAFGNPYMPFVMGDTRSHKAKRYSDFAPTILVSFEWPQFGQSFDMDRNTGDLLTSSLTSINSWAMWGWSWGKLRSADGKIYFIANVPVPGYRTYSQILPVIATHDWYGQLSIMEADVDGAEWVFRNGTSLEEDYLISDSLVSIDVFQLDVNNTNIAYVGYEVTT